MKDAMQKWEREKGVRFLKKMGMRSGQTVLDFGAGVGHYSIPAAIAVGKSGLVYAVDKEQKELDELSRKTKRLNLKNVNVIRTNGVVALDFKDESIDVVFLYDVLHYLKLTDREKLYSEVFRILRQNGFLSVYPKHVLEDSPANEFERLCFEDVKQEILDSAFVFKDKYCGMISHDDTINQGCVFNFAKSG